MQKHKVVPKFVANSNNSDPGGPTIREERKQSIKESASIASLFPPNYSDTDDSSESNETLPRFSHYSNSIMELFSPARSSVSSGSSGASYFSHYSNSIMELFSPARSSVSSGSGGASYFSTGNGPTTFRFNPRNADDTYAEFLGFSGPFGGMGGMGGGGGGGGMRGSRFSSGMIGDDGFASFGEGGGRFLYQGAPRKGSPVEIIVPCSLEELYKGATKKKKISRDIIDISGRPITVEEILTFDIKPGWKKGTKITFPEKGNELLNVIPSDLVFIIDERRHSVFTRDGNDLIVSQKISLAEALTGCAVHQTTLDGRNLIIPINNVISPTYEEVVLREGMPIPKDPPKKGNLRIRFNIKFPTRLTSEQKVGVHKLLGPGACNTRRNVALT